MERVCPRCRGTTPELLCPRCGVRTDAGGGASTAAASGNEAARTGGWLVGLLLAQGLYYAFRHLADAWLLAHGDAADATRYWEDFAGLITDQALQAPALFAGAMLAAASLRRGLLIGASLGLVNALLLLSLPILLHRPTNSLVWYMTPLFHTFVGAVGGAVGSRVWQPAPELPPLATHGRAVQKMLTTILPERPAESTFEATPYLRIFAGVAVAVGGTIGARLIRDVVVVAGGGRGREMEQSIFITWEITVIAQIIGGAIAGGNSRAGTGNGFWVGLPSAILLIVIQAMAGVRLPASAIPGWLIGATPEGSSGALVIQGAQALLLCTLGGWLGSLILPADLGRRFPPPSG